MRILVTGASGFLGGEIVRRLRRRKGDVVIAAGRRLPAFAHSLAFELEDRAAIERGLLQARPDVVAHAAGRIEGDADRLRLDNLVATSNLVEAMAATVPSAGLLLLGSSGQYGEGQPGRLWREDDPCQPVSGYGASKQAAESAAFAIARSAGLAVTSLRLFNVISAAPRGEQALAAFLRRSVLAMSGPRPWRVRMGTLDAVRDFVALDDALTAIERVIDGGVWGGPINVCTGLGRPVRELIVSVADQIAAGLTIEEDRSLGHAGVGWSVGDPARCEARLGFRPSADLSDLVATAGDWLTREANARSRA